MLLEQRPWKTDKSVSDGRAPRDSTWFSLCQLRGQGVPGLVHRCECVDETGPAWEWEGAYTSAWGDVGKCTAGCACVKPQVWPCGWCVCTLRSMGVSVHRCVFIQPSLETDSEKDTAVHAHPLTHTHPQLPPLLSAQNTSAGKTLRHHPGV